jgi:ring-1,2-phenylacetyl-CoA epoxidase subunit PaaE
MSKGFHDIDIAGLRAEPGNALAVALAAPPALRPVFAFTPGQYLTFEAVIGGEPVRRCYSICSAPGAALLEVGIKRVPGGRFSSFVHERLRPGDRLRVMPPAGRFTAPVGGRHDDLMLAAGSGITPILSITRAVLEGEPESRITLIYGNRDSRSIMFKEVLEDLKDRFLDRFNLLHLFSRESRELALMNGRIDGAKLQALATAGLIRPARVDRAFVCGPGGMIEAASASLAALGLPATRIRVERFTPEGGPAPPANVAPPPDPAAGEEGAGVRIEVIQDGIRRHFRLRDPGDTVLEAARKAGIGLPFACAGGMCCTCRCRIVEGSTAMIRNYSLQPWELAAGFTLACQSRPTSARLVLDFDQH